MLKKYWLRAKHRGIPYLLAKLGKCLLRILSWTCRFQIQGLDKYLSLASKKGCIIMLWHNRIAMTSEIFYKFAPQFKYVGFISNSRDGELIAVLANTYKNATVIRVPHNAKKQALTKMVLTLKTKKNVVITPDGPRGPLYQVKPGIVHAAKDSASPIVPLSWSATRFWQLKTWDQLILPKPFSTIHVTLGDAISINDESIDEATHKLEKALISLEKGSHMAIDPTP